MSFEKIPTIRLSDGVHVNAEALRRARYGFVYLDPYPDALLRETMREAFARAEEFFARDIDEKMKCATKSGCWRCGGSRTTGGRRTAERLLFAEQIPRNEI